jgi:hypothetical protein
MPLEKNSFRGVPGDIEPASRYLFVEYQFPRPETKIVSSIENHV